MDKQQIKEIIKEHVRIEVTKACASTWKNTINGISAKGSIKNGMCDTVDNIMNIVNKYF